MRHRFFRLLAAVALISGALGSAHAAAPAAFAAYQYDCVYTTTDESRGFLWDRQSGTPDSKGYFTAARLDVVARALRPCTNPASNEISKSFILVSMHGTLDGTTNFPQLGLGKDQRIADQTYFWYVKPGANGLGGIASWADMDGNGSMDLPVGGRTYTFVIKLVDKGYLVPDWYFRYQIKDTYLGTWATHDEHVAGSGDDGTLNGEVWWGCETGNTKNALGNGHDESNLYMQNAGYISYVTNGAWSYTQDSTLRAPWNSNPSYYEYHQDQNGPNSTDRVWCDTTDH